MPNDHGNPRPGAGSLTCLPESPQHAPISALRPGSRPVSLHCRELAPQGPGNAKSRQDFSCRQFGVRCCRKIQAKSQTIFPKNGNISTFGEYPGLLCGQLPPRKCRRRQDFSCRQFVVEFPLREAVKPPLFVPVFRNRPGQLPD